MVAHVAPAAVALAEFRLLRDRGDGQGELRGVEVAAGRAQDVLHLGYHRRRLAVRFLVVDAAARRHKIGRFLVRTICRYHTLFLLRGRPQITQGLFRPFSPLSPPM